MIQILTSVKKLYVAEECSLEFCINTGFFKPYPVSSHCQIYLASTVFFVFDFVLNSSQSHFTSSRQKEISM